jgi:hypothetical protein
MLVRIKIQQRVALKVAPLTVERAEYALFQSVQCTYSVCPLQDARHQPMTAWSRLPFCALPVTNCALLQPHNAHHTPRRYFDDAAHEHIVVADEHRRSSQNFGKRGQETAID